MDLRAKLAVLGDELWPPDTLPTKDAAVLVDKYAVWNHGRHERSIDDSFSVLHCGHDGSNQDGMV